MGTVQKDGVVCVAFGQRMVVGTAEAQTVVGVDELWLREACAVSEVAAVDQRQGKVMTTYMLEPFGRMFVPFGRPVVILDRGSKLYETYVEKRSGIGVVRGNT